MKRLLAAILILSALYSGYWVLGRVGLGKGLDQAEAALTDVASLSYSDRTVAGFPSRFDTTYRDVDLAWAGGRLQTPVVQAMTLSYRPNQIIAVAPGPHELMLGGAEFRLTPEDLRASLSLRPGLNLEVTEARADLTKAVLTLPDGSALSATRGFAALREAGPARYDLFTEITGLRPSDARPLAGLPPEIDRIAVTGEITLTEPLDRRPVVRAVTAVTLNEGTEIRWGNAVLTASGALLVPPSGLPEGAVTVTLTEWEPLIDGAIALGLLDPEVAKTLRNAAGMLAQDGALSLPLTLSDGRMRLGPFPLGPSPRFAPYRQ